MQCRIYPGQDRPAPIAPATHAPAGPFLARIRPTRWTAVPERPDLLAAAPQPRRRGTGPSAPARGVLRRSRRDGSCTAVPAWTPPVACLQLTAARQPSGGTAHGEPKKKRPPGGTGAAHGPFSLVVAGAGFEPTWPLSTTGLANHPAADLRLRYAPGRRAERPGRQAGTSSPGRCRGRCRAGCGASAVFCR